MADRNNREVTFEIHEHVAVLSEGKDGWMKEVTITSWNGGPAKLDIRSWSPDHGTHIHAGRGAQARVSPRRQIQPIRR